jgi:hypothetical protein
MQARRNAASLRAYLEAHGVNPGWVQPVVIWAGENDKLSVADPACPVWKVEEIQDHVEDLWRKQELSEEQIGKVGQILEQVIAAKMLS